MKAVTVNELKKQIDKLVKNGCGDKKILISSDDEGNEYHHVWFGAGDITEDEKQSLKFCIYDSEILENIDNYIIIS